MDGVHQLRCCSTLIPARPEEHPDLWTFSQGNFTFIPSLPLLVSQRAQNENVMRGFAVAGSLEILYGLWDWAGGVWENQETLLPTNIKQLTLEKKEELVFTHPNFFKFHYHLFPGIVRSENCFAQHNVWNGLIFRRHGCRELTAKLPRGNLGTHTQSWTWALSLAPNPRLGP